MPFVLVCASIPQWCNRMERKRLVGRMRLGYHDFFPSSPVNRHG